MLVATPGRLQQLRTEQRVSLTDIKQAFICCLQSLIVRHRYVVVDEADTLFDPSFSALTLDILASCKARVSDG